MTLSVFKDLRHNNITEVMKMFMFGHFCLLPFFHCLGDESADRMEFYINHLTMEGCDANNIASALMAESECTAVEESSANVVYRPPFPLLDTITEETVEELLLELSDSSSLSASANDESSESPSSNSGRWGWGWGWLNTSDDDSSSVIHMPVGGGPSTITSGSLVRHSEMTDVNSGIYRTDGLDVDFDLGNDDDDFEDNDDGEWSERDQEVPKKKRRIGSSIDEEDKESASSRSPSVTDSLIQFEALEKELVDTESEPFAAEEEEESASAVVFRTSATTLPFEDADDRVLSPETDPEVFLDCHEHLETGGLADEARLLQASSVNFFNFLDSFQETSQTSSQEFYTTCGSDWFSPPSRSWSSMPSLDWNVGDESITEMRSCRSACDVMGMGASGAQLQQTYQGQSAALRPSQPWVITFDPPQEMEEEEEEEEEEEDDQVNDDDHWEPDGFLNSDIEEYDTGSNSDDDDYSTERGDRFDEFGLGFISGRSQRMRSFRSYGDSLNMLDTTDDPILHSNSSSSSSCSPDRSSPEEDHRHPASSRSRHSVEALSEDSGYGDASGSHPLMMQQQQRTSPDNSNNKRAGTSSMEEARMVDPSTPPAKCHHTLELPNSLGLAICLPDGSPPSCSPGDCQWSPEVERATRDEYQDDDDDDDVWEEEEAEEEEEEEEKADELREEDKNEVKDEEMTGQSALLMRRQPRSRPTPLSLKEAEEFLILQDHAAEVVNDGQSRCGVPEICIDLESKMSHTLDGNAATNDDILPDHPGTDLEASKFNPQIGSSGWEEVPDGMGEAVTAGADHTKQAEGKGEEEKEQQHSLLHSTDGGSGFIRPPDASKHNSASHGHNVTYSDSIAMDSAFYPAPVVLKRYGPRQEVEVYISHQQLPVGSEDLDPPVPTSTTVVPSGSSIRGVHFSPVVSAVNWRESYLNQSEDDSDDHSTSNGSAAETNPETKNCSAPPESATKVRVAEVSPSVTQRVKLMPDSPPDVVNVIEADRGTPNSGRNESNSNSCTTTSNSATTTATPTTTTTPPPASSTTTTGNNSKKPPLFQRFSLSRLSARMSATFSRSDSKRESGKKVVGSDGPIPTDAKDVPTTATETTTTSPPVAKGNSKKSSKNKQQPDACPEVKPTSKKIDDFKVVKEPKKRFFSRTFQRSSSTPPMSSSVTAQPEATIQTRATLTAVSPTAATAAAGASGNDNNGATSSSNVSCRPIESVAGQPATTSSNDEKNTPPTSPAAIGDSSRPPVVNSTSPTTSQPSVEPESGSCPPIPSPRSKVQASHAKPPLPPQTKPRTIHARKNYLVQPAEPPPPVPMVSSAGLQHALQHFKETARMDRERLANSVPDLVATAPSTPTPRPTSDCIDPRETNEVTTAPAQQPPACRPVTLFPASRERARQAALSRASSVESAWNATASRAALNLSRRNIASSGSSQDVAGITGGTQGHGRTKSRPVVPGLLETNLDSVPSSYSSNHNYNNPDETNLDELIQNLQLFCNNNKRAVEYSPQPLSVDSASATTTNSDKRFKSMLNLGSSSAPVSVQPDIDMMMTDPTSSSSVRVPDANRAKSMEFLLDEDNKSTVQVRI
ncbi:hypothetical protein DAPPUDRAFT_303196 [Daphnia pulex]|uniref:Uncharacterized protein n=1 Tax=Daphnia pulex TaxID=6669 RepID=E9FTM8_DAPPU|nr:hypothetical protein DAPPUDRAFT_303196 [Daphnia pulex]|eukprot:EFX89610.1 hypothetical protein DAPPUDRAFT_303196 [Daphnia pulex]